MAPQVLRPGTTRRHYAMLWSHAYGRSMGYMCVLWSRGCKIPYVYLAGFVRFTCGHPRGPVDSIRAWEQPCRLGNILLVQGLTGPRTGPCDFPRVYTAWPLRGP